MFNREWFSHSGSLSGRRKTRSGLNFSSENDNFKPRMQISSESGSFARGGMFFLGCGFLLTVGSFLLPAYSGAFLLTVDNFSSFSVFTCELFFPLEGLGSHRGGNPRKMGKNYKIPLPGPTPENGENCPKKGVKLLRKYNFCNFYVIFPHFRGSDRGGELCNFSPFFGDFHPGGFPGPSKGKNNLQVFTYSWSFFAYSFSFFAYSWSFFAYSGKVRLTRALRDCKQRSSTVSKKASTVSKKASPFFFMRSSANDFFDLWDL